MDNWLAEMGMSEYINKRNIRFELETEQNKLNLKKNIVDFWARQVYLYNDILIE